MWSARTHCKELSSGKRPRGVFQGQQAPLATVNPAPDVSIITVAAVKSMMSVTFGNVGGVAVEMMLDSGSSVSLVTQ